MKFGQKNSLILWGAGFSLYVTFLLSGFSLPVWSYYLGSPGQPDVILFGKARDIRSDDFMAILPLAFAQLKTDPQFPVVNPNIVEGQNQLLMVSAPVAHPVTFFRPYLWGYWVGPEFGLSWHWATYVFGFLAAFTLLFSHVFSQPAWGAPVAAFGLLWSPFFQYWGLNSAFLAASGAMSGFAFLQLIFSRTLNAQLSWGLLLGWATGCWVLAIYPPFQIAVAHVVLALVAGVIFRERKRISAKGLKTSTIGLGVALGVVAIGVTSFLISARDEISRVTQTVYPGLRVSTGGGVALFRIFLNNFVPLRRVADLGTVGGNICEAAGFVYFAPFVSLAAFLQIGSHWRSIRRWREWFALRGLVFVLASGMWVVYFIWQWVGFPAPLAWATGLLKVPSYRSYVGMGLADFTLVLAYLASSPGSVAAAKPFKAQRAIYVVLAAFFTIFSFLVLTRKLHTAPSVKVMAEFFLVLFLQLLIGWSLIKGEKKALIGIAVLNLGLTYWFNPLVHRGARVLYEPPFSQALIQIDESFKVNSGKSSSWLFYGDLVTGKLPPALGLRSFNALQFYPQFSFWKKLDPSGEFVQEYNRYAHVSFSIPKVPKEALQIHSPQSDVVNVRAWPDDPKILALDFNYLVYRGQVPPQLAKSTYYRLERVVGDLSIYQKRAQKRSVH